MSKDMLNKIFEENAMNQRYLVTGIDFNPKEKEVDNGIFGAIWFDRECVKHDILREPGIDGEMILIRYDPIPDGGNFKCLFSIFGASDVEWQPNINVGAIYQLVGSMIAKDSTKGMGTIQFIDDPDTTPCASLGFLSEFGYDENGQLIKLP